jgi:hypothetical protein
MTLGSARARQGATIAGLLLLSAAMPPSGSARAGSEADQEPARSGFGRTIVRSDAVHDTSPPLRVLARRAARTAPGGRFQPLRGRGDTGGIGGQTVGVAGDGKDPVVQDARGVGPAMPAPLEEFDGLRNADNGAEGQGSPIPPDTVGDVGPEHYVQMVNLVMAVFDKETGAKLLGPIATNTIWSGSPGSTPCETTNEGDPIVLYDPLADRWVISQFAFETVGVDPVGPYFECIAVSATGDPTGTWHRYAFQMPDPTLLNDYPKLGVWPDAYYMGINEFDQDRGFGFVRASVVAFERDRMLVGAPATMLYKTLGGAFFTPMPADLDGFAPPPPGTPGIFVELEGEEFGYPNDRLHFFEMDVDWATDTAVVTGPTVRTVATANLNQCAGSRDCIPQPDVAATRYLDAIDERLMFRAAYRNLGGHQSIVVNHTVDVLDGAPRRAGVRWYEIRSPAASPSIFQASSYSPTNRHRWMGSIAQDRDGNIALGYSLSSANTTYPSIRYAGRLASDPRNMLPQGETTLQAGGGSQTDTASRWGDYSAMSVDPADDCTFWYTNEYYLSTSLRSWRTRIGSFKFPSCDDDVGTTISIGNSWNVEGSSITFPVTLTNPSVAPVSVEVSTADGSAFEGSDYSATSSLVSFVPGDTVQSITVDTIGDTVDEQPDETFLVQLSSPSGATIDDGTGRGTIHESGPPKCPGQQGKVGNHIVGTGGADTLVGTNGRDIICGLGGPDNLKGRGGTDLLIGGPGTDTLLGGGHRDTMFGGGGADRLAGGDGPDFLFGGAGADRVQGGAAADKLVGNRGADTVLGGAGFDRLEGKAGNDNLFGQRGNDKLFGQRGNDNLFGQRGNDTFNGGPGTDRCVQGPGSGARVACERFS